MHSCLSNVCYIPRPSYPPRFVHLNNVGCYVQIMKLHIFVVMLQIYICKVPGFNVYWVTLCPGWYFLWFSSVSWCRLGQYLEVCYKYFKIAVCWNVKLSCLVDRYKCCGWTCCLLLKGEWENENGGSRFPQDSSVLQMEIKFLQNVGNYQTT